MGKKVPTAEQIKNYWLDHVQESFDDLACNMQEGGEIDTIELLRLSWLHDVLCREETYND